MRSGGLLTLFCTLYTMSRYEFNKTRHLHTLDGKPLTGCTTVLSVVAKPALISWAANKAVDYILNNVVVRGPETTIVKTVALEEARKAHIRLKEKAGTWGTELHAWIEKYVMARILGSNETIIDPEEDGAMSFSKLHFTTWVNSNKVKFLESEKNIYSEKMWIGGICDIVCEIDGKIWIADVKTGSGIYPEHFWQMAGYDLCLTEMGLYDTIEGYIVLNLKKDGTFEEKRSISKEENKEAFKACLTIYRIQEKLKNQII